MSLFNKMLASVGIGSAEIDTKLERDRVVPGEIVKGIVEVKGGNIDQEIDSLYLNLYTTYIKEVDDRKVTNIANIGHFLISNAFPIGRREHKKIPFSFQLPYDTPATYGRTKIWVTTGADIKSAVDPKDKDYLRVETSELAGSVIQAIHDLGFRLRNADCEVAPRFLRTRLPIIQEFEFVPSSGQFRGRLDEVEIVFFNQSEQQLEIFLEVDRRARGLGSLLAEALEMDETKIRLSVTKSDIPYMKQKINEVISRYTY